MRAALAACALSAAAAAAAATSAVVTLGAPLPLRDPLRCADAWVELEAAARAVRYVGAADWWRATGLGLRLEVLPADDAFTAWAAASAFSDSAPPPCGDGCAAARLGLLGPAATDAATLVKLVGRDGALAQMSYAATLDALTPSPYVVVPDNYTAAVQPLFRSSHTDEQAAVALVAYLARHFEMVSLLHAKGAAGNGAAAAVQDAARASGGALRVVATANFVSGSDASIHGALEAVAEEAPRVVVLVAGPADAARVLAAAGGRGMTGKGWTWAGTGEWVRELTSAAAPALTAAGTGGLPADETGQQQDDTLLLRLRRRLTSSSSSSSSSGSSGGVSSDAVRAAMAGVIAVAPAGVTDLAALPVALASFVLPGGRFVPAAVSNATYADVLLLPPGGVLPPPTPDSCPPLFTPGVAARGLPLDGSAAYVFDAVWGWASAVADASSGGAGVNGTAAPPARADVVAALTATAGASRLSPLTASRLRFFRNGDREGAPLALVNVRDTSGVPAPVALWTPIARRGASQPHMIEGDGSVGAGAWGPDAQPVIWASGTADVPTDRDMEGSHSAAIAGAVALVGVALSLLAGAVIHHMGVTVLPESGATVLIGAGMGLLLRFGFGAEVASQTGFSEEGFFFLLLPVIIFESGFALPLTSFFTNLGSISAFAVLGTLISTYVIGSVVYAAGARGLSVPLTWEESMAFASLLSATDPVATLAVFGALRVDPTLNALVYGEAVVNDAVAIVLYRTFTAFLTSDVTAFAGLTAVGSFFTIMLVSVLIGAASGLACTLAFRFVNVSGQSRDVRWQKALAARVAAVRANTARLMADGAKKYLPKLPPLTSPKRRQPGAAAVSEEAGSQPQQPAVAGSSVPGTPVAAGSGLAGSADAAVAGEVAAPVAHGTGGASDELVDLVSGAAETAVVLVFSYISFLVAEAVALSGIVSSLSCGITMSLYTKAILTRDGRLTSTAVLRMLAALSDTLVFFSIGLSVALTLGAGGSGGGGGSSGYNASFISLTLVACLLGRALNVFPISAALNLRRKEKISLRFQTQMWHAGLRGAIAYASALSFPSQHREAVLNCTSAVVLVTLFAMGGTTVPLLRALDVPYGVDPPPVELDRLLGGGGECGPAAGSGGQPPPPRRSAFKRGLAYADGAVRRLVYGREFLQEMEALNDKAEAAARERALRATQRPQRQPSGRLGGSLGGRQSSLDLAPAGAVTLELPTPRHGGDGDSGGGFAAPLAVAGSGSLDVGDSGSSHVARNLAARGWDDAAAAAGTAASAAAPSTTSAAAGSGDDDDVELRPWHVPGTVHAPGGAAV